MSNLEVLVYFCYTSTSQSFTKGSQGRTQQGRNLAGADTEAIEYCLLACSPPLLVFLTSSSESTVKASMRDEPSRSTPAWFCNVLWLKHVVYLVIRSHLQVLDDDLEHWQKPIIFGLCGLTGQFSVNLSETRVIWKGGPSVEKFHPPWKWPVVHFLNWRWMWKGPVSSL